MNRRFEDQQRHALLRQGDCDDAAVDRDVGQVREALLVMSLGLLAASCQTCAMPLLS